MCPDNPTVPEWQKGLIKRKWIYLVFIVLSLFLIAHWFLNRNVSYNRELPSFEVLSQQINFEDTLFTSSWRRIWLRLPNLVQVKLDRWKPAPPATQVRLTACAMLADHGAKALPLLLEKLNDPDDKMKGTALHSICVLEQSNQQTWDSLTTMIQDKSYKTEIRCQAMLVLTGLHREDFRFMDFLNKWIVTDDLMLDYFSSISSYNPYSSISRLTVSNTPESRTLSYLGTRIDLNFHLSLFQKKTPDHAKLAFCFLKVYFQDVSSLKNDMPGFIDDEDDFVRENAYQILARALERERPFSGAPEYFFRAASDPLTSVQRLATRFLGNSFEPTPQILKVLFELAGSADAAISQSALMSIARVSVVAGKVLQPNEHQLAIVEKLSKSGDPITHQMASDLLGRWMEGSFEELLESFLHMKFPHGTMPSNSLASRISEMYHQSDDHKKIVMNSLRDTCLEAQSLRGEISSFLMVAEPDEPVPVLLQIRMDQACRKRSWLFSLTVNQLDQFPEFVNALGRSADDSLNPNQFQDATTRWIMDSNLSRYQSHLEFAYQSSSPLLQSQSIEVMKKMGLAAVPVLEQFLQHEEERTRIHALVLICEILQEMDRIEPYLEFAAKLPGPTILKVVKQLKEYYSKPPGHRGHSFQSMLVR